MVTSNHVHLLIKDTGQPMHKPVPIVPVVQSLRSVQNVQSCRFYQFKTHKLLKFVRERHLIAGRTGQEYNERKRRHGAFWEDRYHATAIETDEHLHRCLVYIDLNMVRVGVVEHPVNWLNSGYREIQQPPKRYAVIDSPGLVALCGFSKLADFQQAHCRWVDTALEGGSAVGDVRWSEAVAVGSRDFVEKVRSELGIKALHREPEQVDGTYTLREPGDAYRAQFDIESETLSANNTLPWKTIAEVAIT